MTLKIILLSCIFFLLHVFAVRNDPSFRITYDAPNGALPARGKIPARFSSKLQFSDKVWDKVLGGDAKKLSQIAKDAWWQMNENANSMQLKVENRPKVMTALAVGNDLYLSSSLMGNQAGTNSYVPSLHILVIHAILD